MKDKHNPQNRQKLFLQFMEYFKGKERIASLVKTQPATFVCWIRTISTGNEHKKYRCTRPQQVASPQEKCCVKECATTPKNPDKFSFVEIRNHIQFDNVLLARIADVNLIVVYKMLVGNPIKRWQAEEVLKALTNMTGIHYTLDTVDIVLYPE